MGPAFGRSIVVLLWCAATLAPAAHASTVTTDGGCDRYMSCWFSTIITGSPGERNDLKISRDGGLTIEDRGAPIVAGKGCTALDEHRATCDQSDEIDVDAGDRDDRVDASGDNFGTYIDGGPGNDVLLGGSAHDEISGGSGSDIMDGGPGVDVVVYRGEKQPIVADMTAQVARVGSLVERFSNFEQIYSGAGDDRLVGTDGNDVLDGGDGDDVLVGLGGNDGLNGGRGRDILRGGPGDDGLRGPESDVSPGDFADVIDCGDGRDSVNNAGARQIIDESCEALWTDAFGDPPFALRSSGPPRLSLGKRLVGPPMELRATLRVEGSASIERRLALSVPSGDDYPEGYARLVLSSPRIERLRRHGNVLVDVGVHAFSPGFGPEPGKLFHYRSHLRIRLHRR